MRRRVVQIKSDNKKFGIDGKECLSDVVEVSA